MLMVNTAPLENMPLILSHNFLNIFPPFMIREMIPVTIEMIEIVIGSTMFALVLIG